jgi:hypothetical protein
MSLLVMRRHCADQITPPLARMMWPLTQPLSALAGKATTQAISSGWLRRPNGFMPAMCWHDAGDLPEASSQQCVVRNHVFDILT